MATQMKFKCTSCQHIFEHDAYQKECFCPKCGSVSERLEGTEGTVICSECGTELPATATSCPTCGCPVSAVGGRHCHECGAGLAASAQVCPQCGCPVAPSVAVSPVPPVSITQTAAPMGMEEEQELSLPKRNTAFYWLAGGILLFLLVGFGVLYYTTDVFKSTTKTESIAGSSRQVVIDGVNLRLRYSPSPDAETFKWADGTNRHPEKGERYPYLGEEGDFYKINYKGHILYVSKQHTYVE